MRNINKYQAYPQIELPQRQWPQRRITQAPQWCSVDLRDGNQALITPMALEEKLEFFARLAAMGFRQIEVGFPSASQVEFDFIRTLIDERLIPDTVTIQVLVQARKHLIEKTFAALRGAQLPIIHLYNSTSVNQRKIVFGKTEREIIEIALQGVNWIKEQVAASGQQVQLQYSPESFTGTELQFAVDICNAVIDEWQPTPAAPMIVNLPATVELATPNVYADQIEWVSGRLNRRDSLLLSVHAHNDRGTAIAATELALLAGAQRVEGTLFGNGERTGNADIVALALNLYTQGIDPGLDVFHIDELVGMYEKITRIAVHPRHPYAGSLVYTAFSGSHQDAIKKGMQHQAQKQEPLWEVPYLPLDPSDIGRSYEGIIRINSQSGKGGTAFILEKELGYQLPKQMQPEFAAIIQAISDRTGKEVDPAVIVTTFEQTYLAATKPILLRECDVKHLGEGRLECSLTVEYQGQTVQLQGVGNGPLDACKSALMNYAALPQFNIQSYSEHSLKQGSDSSAIAYIEIETPHNRTRRFGAGIDTDITIAAVKSLLSALNRCVGP